MADRITKKQRSKIMSCIRSENTSLEVSFRKLLSKNKIKGYRLHYKILGKPDIAFLSKKLLIFLDGCFWHKCPRCFKYPASNKKFWNDKILKNEKRDKKVTKILSKQGYKILRFWEHEIKENPNKCISKMNRLLSPNVSKVFKK